MHKKIKVVFVINNFLIGGVERLFFDIISFLDKEKYDIKIVTVLGSGPLEASFRSLRIPIYFADPPWFCFKKLSFRTYWPLIAPFTLIRITFFLFKSKPDIVVSSLYQADFLSMIAAKIVGVKERIVVQTDVSRFGKFLFLMKKTFPLRFATKIISVSETARHFLIDYFKVKNERITTIFNGIDYERFKLGKKLVTDQNSPVIGIVGRLEEVKGQIYALEALKILQEKHNLSPSVLLAGDGSLRTNLENYVTENKLNSVKFLGSVYDVPKFLSQVDILIIPSVEEGFGLVVLEGMVSGKAVVASNIPVMKELIQDGETGILFESQNADSLAHVLFNILSNNAMCEKLQKNASLFAEKNKNLFEIREVSKTYQKLLVLK